MRRDLVRNDERFIPEIHNFREVLEKYATETEFPVIDFVYSLDETNLFRVVTALGMTEKIKKGLKGWKEADYRSFTVFQLCNNSPSIDKILSNDMISNLVSGFSLAKGESLAGVMRNLIGNIGEDRVHKVLIDHFDGKVVLSVKKSDRPKVIKFSFEGTTLFAHFNVKLHAAGKNLDLVITDSVSKLSKECVPEAVMEIKSGIDPAGEDEHWSTARSKLQQVKNRVDSVKCGYAAMVVGPKTRTEVREEVDAGQLVCGVNLNDDKEIEQGLKILLS